MNTLKCGNKSCYKIDERLLVGAVTHSLRFQAWKFNAHFKVKGADTSDLAFCAFFSRNDRESSQTKNSELALTCSSALINCTQEEYTTECFLNESAVKQIDEEVKAGLRTNAEIFNLTEFSSQILMRHEHLVGGNCVCENDALQILLSNVCNLKALVVGNECTYHVTCHDEQKGSSVKLQFSAARETACRNTFSSKSSSEFADYFFPAMRVSGSVVVEGEEKEVEGLGWHEHVLSPEGLKLGPNSRAFSSHFSLHISSTCTISVYHTGVQSNSEADEKVAFLSGKNGMHCFTNSDVEITYVGNWVSFATFASYPAECELRIASADFYCLLRPVFAGQELVTSSDLGNAALVGSVKGSGRWRNSDVHVRGFWEYRCPLPYRNVEGLLQAVSVVTKRRLCEMYPLSADTAWVAANVTGRYTIPKGTPPDKICETLFKPVRSLIERNGKAWRSLLLALCCNMLSSQHFDCGRYIAMTELLHLGSLIIDDIQDHSLVRRGGPCVHVEVGVPTAINAGTACYFMGPQLARLHELTADKSSRIYQLYFDILRTGHVGQGLDLHGLDYLMPDVVRTGDTALLRETLEAIHMYKTGIAAGGICRIACILCDASEEVASAVECFGTKLGLAFQIVDDALDVRGFEGNRKDFAEDIKSGKITYPVAITMGSLDYEQRVLLWSLLHAEVKNEETVQRIIDLVKQVKAIEKCFDEARVLVKEAWDSVSMHLAESYPKGLLRVFCDYLTARTY